MSAHLSWLEAGVIGAVLVLATIPVGVVGLAGEHVLRTHLARPVQVLVGSALSGVGSLVHLGVR